MRSCRLRFEFHSFCILVRFCRAAAIGCESALVTPEGLSGLWLTLGYESAFLMKSIYVGNLPFSATEEEVQNLFAGFGEVSRVHLVKDRETGRPRGFGFVEMPDDDSAAKAIEGLDQSELDGRTLRINEAQPREPRSGGGGGGGYGGGGGGGGYRGGGGGGNRGGGGGRGDW